MFHLVAYHSSLAASGTLTAMTPVTDPTVTINGNHILVPDKYNQVLGAAGFDSSGTVTRNQLQSPSLRELFFPEVRNIGPALPPGRFTTPILNNDSPIPLKTNEGLDYYQDGGGASSNQYGLVWLSDGPVTPVKGPIYTMEGTTAITQTTNTWVDGAITFDQTLPVGNYQIVGLRVYSNDAVAARLLFVGASAITRPGVVCDAYNYNEGRPGFDNGQAGVYGTFNSLTPPTLEILGGAATSQQIEVDLLPVAG